MNPLFLQTEYSIKDDLQNPVFTLILYLVVLLVSVLITRAIFSIPTFLKYQKAQIFLLAKIARQQNVPEIEIKEIMNKLEIYESKESNKPES